MALLIGALGARARNAAHDNNNEPPAALCLLGAHRVAQRRIGLPRAQFARAQPIDHRHGPSNGRARDEPLSPAASTLATTTTTTTTYACKLKQSPRATLSRILSWRAPASGCPRAQSLAAAAVARYLSERRPLDSGGGVSPRVGLSGSDTSNALMLRVRRLLASAVGASGSGRSH